MVQTIVKDIRRVDAVSIMNALSQCKVSSLPDKTKRIGLVIMMAALRQLAEEFEALRLEATDMLSEKEARETLQGWLQQTSPIETVQLSEDDVETLIEANSELPCGTLSTLMLLRR